MVLNRPCHVVQIAERIGCTSLLRRSLAPHFVWLLYFLCCRCCTACSDFGPTGFISVYTFKRWDANYQHLLDFKVFDPANDGCASPAEV